MRWLSKVLIVLVAAGAVLVVALPVLRPAGGPVPLPRSGPALADVATWGYQLQHVDPETIPDGIDMLVTDFSRDGSDTGSWTASEVAALRQRVSGKQRIVLAYLSIGEAESYRGYWRQHWRVAPPRWLGAENKDWKGNYAVRFWDPDWQRQIFDLTPGLVSRTLRYWLPALAPEPYLDRILAAGFDGVFLDKVDGYEDWPEALPGAADDMIRFVTAIAAYARTRRPGFLVVPQNAEELLAADSYRTAIDAIAKEDLFYGIAGDDQPNDPADIAAAEAHLTSAVAAGKAVFVVEYVTDPEVRRILGLRLKGLGFRPAFAGRELHSPPEMLEDAAPAAAESGDALAK